MKSQDEEDQITKDWKFAATVIDRFLLWFFTIATVLASFIILLSAPEMFSQVDTHWVREFRKLYNEKKYQIMKILLIKHSNRLSSSHIMLLL